MLTTGLQEVNNTTRVLIFSVDDGSFCIHLEWVEAVYKRQDIALHHLKSGAGAPRSFLIHRGQPAWVVDLREAFGLEAVLGSAERMAFAVIRAGSALLALPVDACVGVRDLDLGSKVPVPSSLLRDGGTPVGHLVEIDGTLHGLLEPSRIPSSMLRDELDPLLKEALAFRDREERINALGTELRRAPSLNGLRTFGRLSRRNGRPRVANAVRVVLKAAEASASGLNGGIAGNLGGDTLLRDLATLSAAKQTGELRCELADGPATLYFDAGRIADACTRGEWGRGALKEILACRAGTYRFTPSDAALQAQRIDDATLWVLIEAIEQLAEERRARHLR